MKPIIRLGFIQIHKEFWESEAVFVSSFHDSDMFDRQLLADLALELLEND